MKTKQKKQKFSLLTVAQAGYMTMDFFGQNDLGSHACACAFGFLLSFLPLALMAFSILMMTSSASGEAIKATLSSIPFFENTFKFSQILSSLDFSGSITIVQVILGFWVFRMARNLFLYIQKGIMSIFRTEAPKRGVLNQLLILAGEILLILGAAALVLLSASIRNLTESATLSGPLGLLVKVAKFIPYALLFLTIFLTLKFYTGTRPPAGLCLLSTLLCTGLFVGVVLVLNMVLDFERYSKIYGILGNLIILLFEVQIFFLFLFVFAQLLFTLQFFDHLLLAELYLLPSQKEKGLMNALRRRLFISPDFLIRKFETARKSPEGERIITKGEVCNTVYYIISGTVVVSAEAGPVTLPRGTLFGEVACLLNVPRTADCTAGPGCCLLEISGATFRRLIDLNGSVAKKAIANLSAFLGSQEAQAKAGEGLVGKGIGRKHKAANLAFFKMREKAKEAVQDKEGGILGRLFGHAEGILRRFQKERGE